MTQEQEDKAPKTAAKVLVVDDNPANIDVMVRMLEPEGYNLAIATHGEKAMKVADHFLPDLILLDVIMPGMDGFEICRLLKKNSVTQEIPIIFVTAKRENEAIVKGFESGGQDYISKPFNREEVLSRVRTHLRLRMLMKKQDRLIADLTQALDRVRQLSGLLPICSSCKKIRDDGGDWHQLETYIKNHSEAVFSHGICPDCISELYPGLMDKIGRPDPS